VSLSRIFGALVRSNDRRFVFLLCNQADLALESLELLRAIRPEDGDLTSAVEEIKNVERRGDAIRRVLVDELFATYSTPFDREDIFALSRRIDDIIDAVDAAARELCAARSPRLEHLPDMTAALIDGARHIRVAVEELRDNPLVAVDHAVRAKKSENRMASFHHDAVDSLLQSEKDIGQLLRAREIYRRLKHSADRIDEVADDISMIAIKRS
jgi:uncharacterized protein Yka (UPF0111/DUF47 family)